jgi:hypothetical protein
MAPTLPSTSLVRVQPAFTAAERLALAGYLAGFRSSELCDSLRRVALGMAESRGVITM